MAISSVAAVQILFEHVAPLAALLSLSLNIIRRHRELSNFCIVVAVMFAASSDRREVIFGRAAQFVGV
eukprot:scaffold8478_cov286-Pinguiococcus_pyrenoidosus.AAC.6